MQLSVIADDFTDPPSGAAQGDRYLIPANGGGEWAQRPRQIAAFQDGAWAYFIPNPGWQSYVQSRGLVVMFDGTQWSAPHSAAANSASFFGINTAADTTNRLAVKSDAVLLSHDRGGSHQMKINKASAGDTASLVLQSGFTGHAEIGLTGDMDLHVKISADGSNFQDVLIASPRGVATPLGLHPQLYIDGTDAAGGDQIVMGPPNVLTVAVDRDAQDPEQDRVYFSAFYVDRPTAYLGGVCAPTNGANAAGNLIRARLYSLGVPNGNSWAVGQRIADLGAQSADSAGHLEFDLPVPITLKPRLVCTCDWQRWQWGHGAGR